VASIKVRCVTGADGINDLRADWNAFYSALPDAGFHHAYAWFASYLNNLEDDPAAVRIFSFYRAGRLVAIIPLRRVRQRVAGLPLRVWELPWHPHMNLCDTLIAPGEEHAAVMNALLAELRHMKDLPWDALHFRNLLDSSCAVSALRGTGSPRTMLSTTGSSMVFDTRSLDSALAGSSTHFKRNLRRQRRKLEQLGAVSLTLANDEDELPAAFAEFLKVESSGWKGADGSHSAITLHPHLVNFYRDLMQGFGAHGRCLIALMKLDGRTIAAQFCLLTADTVHVLKIAYDESLSAEAPGHQLMHELLKHCSSSPSINRLSLVTGPVWAQGRWNPASIQVSSIFLFNHNWPGLIAFSAKRMKQAVDKTVKFLSSLQISINSAARKKESVN
jgi:CelD/BcsL family acetyltransferase involved in cellulose biosynthesis